MEIKTYTEEELISAIKQRNQHAFAYLYDNYSSNLFSLIFLLLKDNEEAEDVLQIVFLKFWNSIDNYDSNKGKLYTWMINITRNATIDRIRSKDSKNKNKIQEVEESVYIKNGLFTENKKHETIGLSIVLTKLSNEENLLIQLAYFEGYTQNEIAEHLNIPLGTVKTKIRQTLLKLRHLTIEKHSIKTLKKNNVKY